MRLSPRALVVTAFLAGVVVFCVVQDRVTAAGARQYVLLQRAALEGRGAPVTIDEVLEPAVRSSVRQGLLAGGLVAAVGLVGAGIAARRRPRAHPTGKEAVRGQFPTG